MYLMSQKKWNENTAQAFDHMAGEWNQKSDVMWESGSRRTILPFLTRYVLPEQGPVLDAGCGDGFASCKLASLGYQVEGVDIAGEMIRLAQLRAQKNGLDVHFQTGDISQLPFADQSFAGILTINVVEFTPSPLKSLFELHRLLQPGGVLVLGILGPTAGPRNHSYRRLYGETTIQNTMMPWEAKQLALENGFVLLDEEPVYKDGVPSELAGRLSVELREALSFLTLFALKKGD
jgi:ubiquinone/menaquinone biosynthesis C-methylase UbiE